MKTTDIFKTTSAQINESMEKTFGKKVKLETFTSEQLEDARNKLRTQLHQVRSNSSFNENVESDAFYEAQWMLDAINAELAEREEVEVESVEEGEEMSEEVVTEGEVEQASAIVTANTMVDRVGRWIEELSGMENETMLQLGDSIRDEFGQDQSRTFIETTSPAIQQALETLKATRETIASSVRVLSGEEAPTEMLGDEPEAAPEEEMAAAPEDEMNAEVPAEEAPAEDEFAAAEPAAGGEEAAGREQRESINRSSNLLRTLAG